MIKEKFIKILKEESLKNNIELNQAQLEDLYNYKNMLIEWNLKMNLTAITDDYEIIIKHFIDCLQCTKYINKNEQNDTKIIDVGTGAGFPGIVVAIFFKNKVNITLLDSLNKRLIFLNEVKEKLNLKNVEILHKRAEECAHDINYREKYDYVLSRAVASLNILLEYTIPYLKLNGYALYLKGDNINQEINESKKALKILNSEITDNYNYILINKEKQFNRNILKVKKLQETIKKYPRIYGKIKKSPL